MPRLHWPISSRWSLKIPITIFIARLDCSLTLTRLTGQKERAEALFRRVTAHIDVVGDIPQLCESAGVRGTERRSTRMDTKGAG